MVHAALNRVSLLNREVLVLFFLDDLTVAEVAQVLSIPEGTVKSRLHYAKRALREILDQMGYSHEE
jgi:RNA polymerase sigma-70 factor, ECF subfamily